MTYLVNIDGLTFTLQGKDYILEKGSTVELPKSDYVDTLVGRGHLTASSTPAEQPKEKFSPSKDK